MIAAARAHGGANLLINAAGVNRFALFEQLDEAALDDLIDLNIKATLQLTCGLLPLLREQPGR